MHFEELLFAECLLKEQFGSVVQRVGHTLMQTNCLTIAEIVNEIPSLGFLSIRNALLVLIQHNIVFPQFPERPIPISGVQTAQGLSPMYYNVRRHELMQRMRYPRFLYFVATQKGHWARSLLCEVMKHGRATLLDTVKSVISNAYNHIEAVGVDHSATISEQDLKVEFVRLLASNILHKCESFMTDPTSTNETQKSVVVSSTTSSRKRRATQLTEKNGSKKAKSGDDSNKYETKVVELQAMTTKGDSFEENDTLFWPMAPIFDPSCNVSSKTGKAEFASVENPFSNTTKQLLELAEKAISEKNAFRVNSQYLTFQLCKQVAENVLTSRMGDNTLVRLTLRALLDRTYQMNNDKIESVREVKSQSMSLDEIANAIAQDKAYEGKLQSASKNTILRILDVLMRHPDQCVSFFVEGSIYRYSVNWIRIRLLLQRRIIFDEIRSSCGDISARIWSLLNFSGAGEMAEGKKRKYWDDQTIAESALVTPHTAREAIYKLADAGMVRLHESDNLSSANTSAANRHSLFISSNEEQCKQQTLHNARKMSLNLLERKQEEIRRILQMSNSMKALSDVEKKELRDRERGDDILEAHFIKLDESLLILCDF
ncbi:Dna-directed Rna polymerase III POLR3C [Cardiosporidium cionae]|uniref:DNA-directed RNA polymerase III subunit RPC3 n=1 Tax=Cardiosporidium cionae TaxID=476202 RepID=A0ABQ7J5P0_9APIC|nr:Dna-directed Rna polymerase III POLR3C [Cardiosporidium cionae]|eukprot:KAF8819306.1 Dna-directed Rna polymerase III POLR3C [Cardiosporidium cionae]